MPVTILVVPASSSGMPSLLSLQVLAKTFTAQGILERLKEAQKHWIWVLSARLSACQ